MLRDLSKVVDKAESMGKTQADFEMAAAMLLQKQFLWSDGHGQNKYYQLIIHYREYFEDLFNALNSDLVIEVKYGYCGIIPRHSKPALNKLETIFLLLLMKIHDGECRKACTENGRSSPNPAHLTDLYVELIQQPKPPRNQTIAALKRLAKQGVVQLGDNDEIYNLPKLTVMPNIHLVVSMTYLDELEGFSNEDGPADTDIGNIDINDNDLS